MTRWFTPVALLAVLCLSTSCGKSVGEYLQDLRTLDVRRDDQPFESGTVVFDAGQLGHEAITGLASAEEMSLPQALEALARGGLFIDANRCKNALLRADAAVLIGRLAMRIPIDPVTEPYEYTENTVNLALEQVKALEEARGSLEPDVLIAALDSPDEVARQAAADRIKEVAPEVDFGYDVGAWRAWWEEERPNRIESFKGQAREPVRVLGLIRFASLGDASSVLGYLAVWMRQYQDPVLLEVLEPAARRVARQTVVHALSRSIADPDAQVRSDVADAIAMVRDPDFGAPLLRQLQRDRDPLSAAKIVRALRHYPGRRTVLSVVAAMYFDHRIVQENARETLVALTGVDHQLDADAWNDWWQKTGEKIWP